MDQSGSDAGVPASMDELITFDPQLTRADHLVLESLASDVRGYEQSSKELKNHTRKGGKKISEKDAELKSDTATLALLDALNNPAHEDFEVTVFTSVDLRDLQVPKAVNRWLLQPYIKLAQSIVRHKTDVVFLTHLILYFTTTVPSTALLFWHFTWVHGILHFIIQFTYMGGYTIMMHQHIHQRGVLRKELAIIDSIFPYILDPLMGHTWNSYFYHHVKHHHVEGNGPDDLSSTIRYQRDNALHFLHYFARFFLLAWVELPLYFLRTKRPLLGLKSAFWEWSSYALMYVLWTRADANATLCAVVMPFLLMRVGLMAGNWGQHAFVDDEEPDSDYRSSITVIDIASNRYCFNDGYHTSHHLNPLRHWREHPRAFLAGKQAYAGQGALVFHNIDYLMITLRLLRRDYAHLARCLVPIGPAQAALSLEQRADMLRRHARAFSEEEVARKFPRSRAAAAFVAVQKKRR